MNEWSSHTISQPQLMDTRSAFDAVASIYDGPFGNNALIQRMRQQVWREILGRTYAGAHILDLGCGTGIDAVYLAGLGYRVCAVDSSQNMAEMTSRRVAGHGLSEQVTVIHTDLNVLSGLSGNRFDAIYSNFGALNCVFDIQKLAEDCAGLLQQGGVLITNVMGKYCPWETGYYLLHGHPHRAFFRWSSRFRPVPLSNGKVWTRYYTPYQWYRSFAKYFEMTGYRAMSLIVPPPYLESLVESHPGLFHMLHCWDEKLSSIRFFRNMGDHFLMTLRIR